MGVPSAFAPNSIVSGSIFKNPDTVAYRPTSSVRQSSGSVASADGTFSFTSISAARRSAREMTASIASHTSATRTSSSGPPHPSDSNRASTATASRAEALASLGCLRTFSLFAAVCALFSSSVAISRSSSSRVSSIDLPSRCRTVASKVASRRPSGCRRSAEASARIPYLASSPNRRCGTSASAPSSASSSPRISDT